METKALMCILPAKYGYFIPESLDLCDQVASTFILAFSKAAVWSLKTASLKCPPEYL